MVRRRDDVVGLETSIIMHPKVWEASGHVAGFTDPLVDCKVSKQRYRADQLFFAKVVVDGTTVGSLKSSTPAARNFATMAAMSSTRSAMCRSPIVLARRVAPGSSPLGVS